MNKLALAVSALFITTIGYSQVIQTRYFNNSYLQREVPEPRAKFAQTAIRNPDGSVTTEVKDIRKNQVISTETFKGDEPAGIWKYKRRNIPRDLNYSFDLVYSDRSCTDSIAGLKDYWEDNDTFIYQAPKISGSEQTLTRLIEKNIIYPDAAREGGIQGRVLMTLTIGANGNIENIVVKQGVNVLLDKEAVRVMRLLKLSSPPMLDGKPIAVCITMPLSFALE